MKWTVTAVRDRTDLQQILALQRENLAPALSREEARAQGFVTVEHTLETLEQMHALAPSIVVKAGSGSIVPRPSWPPSGSSRRRASGGT